MKELIYKTHGTCAQAIRIVIDDNECVDTVEFMGGCNGNTSGISALVRGMKVEDVVKKLRGITCGFKNTSCPDQLSKALEETMTNLGQECSE